MAVVFCVLVIFHDPQAAQGVGINTNEFVQLVAVQLTLDLNDYWTAEAFAAKINQLMEQVSALRDARFPALVVFPEDVGMMLVVQSMRRQLEKVQSIRAGIDAAIRYELLPVLWTRLRTRLTWLPALFLARHKAIAATYFDVFSRAASCHKVYLLAGSVLLPPYAIEDGTALWRKGPLKPEVRNTSYLFDPSGKIVGKQDKICLVELEGQAMHNLACGSLADLKVFDTPVGAVGIAICLDAFHDTVTDTLVTQGAQILVQPSANPDIWNKEQQIDWLNSSYRQTYTEKKFAYAVNPMLNGHLWNMAFFGQSSIIARNPGIAELLHYRELPPAPGFVRVSQGDNTQEVLAVLVPHPSRLP